MLLLLYNILFFHPACDNTKSHREDNKLFSRLNYLGFKIQDSKLFLKARSRPREVKSKPQPPSLGERSLILQGIRYTQE